jgi:hypothetical protein
MVGIGNNNPVTGQQVIQNYSSLNAQQKKVVDTGLQQLNGNEQTRKALQVAANHVKQGDKFGIRFSALPEKPGSVSYGVTQTRQSGEDDPIDSAHVKLNPKAIFKGGFTEQVKNFGGTLFNELASMFAGGKSKEHEAVSDMKEALALKVMDKAQKGDAGHVTGQEIVEQAKKQRGGNVLDGLNQLGVYKNKPTDKEDTTTQKLVAMGVLNQDQAGAINQALGVNSPRKIDAQSFKQKAEGKHNSGINALA